MRVRGQVIGHGERLIAREHLAVSDAVSTTLEAEEITIYTRVGDIVVHRLLKSSNADLNRVEPISLLKKPASQVDEKGFVISSAVGRPPLARINMNEAQAKAYTDDNGIESLGQTNTILLKLDP